MMDISFPLENRQSLRAEVGKLRTINAVNDRRIHPFLHTADSRTDSDEYAIANVQDVRLYTTDIKYLVGNWCQSLIHRLS
jgi:hypothetical protein